MFVLKEYESFCLKVKLNHQEILMVLAYHSPSGDTEIFVDESEKLLSKLKCHQHPVIIIGDFDMDLLSLQNTKIYYFIKTVCHMVTCLQSECPQG